MTQAFLRNLQPPTQIRGAPQLLSTRFSNFPHSCRISHDSSCAFCILYLRSTNSSCKTSFPVRAVTMSLSSPACSWQHSAHDGQGLHKPVQLCDASLIYPVYMFQAYQQKGWRVVTNLLKLCPITLRRKWNYDPSMVLHPSQGIHVAARSKRPSVIISL